MVFLITNHPKISGYKYLTLSIQVVFTQDKSNPFLAQYWWVVTKSAFVPVLSVAIIITTQQTSNSWFNFLIPYNCVETGRKFRNVKNHFSNSYFLCFQTGNFTNNFFRTILSKLIFVSRAIFISYDNY